MINDSDRDFITLVNTRLQQGHTWQQIANEVEQPLSTVYLRIRRLGYKVGKSLVPINAKPLNGKAAA